ncbi:MAG: SDR family oxidoreductase [Candidatus Firestonebacteria bacterium]|nr:SDR family oxidoreductase [Candidatus Firestonebacteria bacterium]
MQRTALITGAARGIGLAIAELFRQEGIRVIAPARGDMDLASPDSIQKYVANLPGPVHILVNNAGINPISPLTMLQDRDIEETLQVNLRAPLLLMRLLLPGMVENRYGRVLNISSIWSQVAKPGRGIYAATKSALNALTRTAAVEVAPYQVLVNALAPGFVNTELTRKNNSPEELAKIAQGLPLQRLADPGEIAELAYFLCSDKNTFMTGQTLFADGGFTCL